MLHFKKSLMFVRQIPPANKGELVLIYITAKRGEPTQIHPDPATVPVGDTVAWKLDYDGGSVTPKDPVELTVYFGRGSPFKWHAISVPANPNPSGHHEGTVEGGPTQETGDYKYGVRLSNARTKEPLSDDDPRLVVIATLR